MALETGIFLSQAIWLWRVRHVRKQAKKECKTYDEYVTEHPSKKLPRSGPDAAIADVEAGHTAQSSGTMEKPMFTDKTTDPDRNAPRTTLVSRETPDQNVRTNEATSVVDTPTMPEVAYPERVSMPKRGSSGPGFE